MLEYVPDNGNREYEKIKLAKIKSDNYKQEQRILKQSDSLDLVFNKPKYFYVNISRDDVNPKEGIDWPLKIQIFDADLYDKHGNIPLNQRDIQIQISRKPIQNSQNHENSQNAKCVEGKLSCV